MRRVPTARTPAPVTPPHVWTVPPLGRERRVGQSITTVRQLIEGRAGAKVQPIYTLPPYQRQHVWTVEQSSAYLTRIMLGLPGGTILVWERDGDLILVDGQQRLTALGCDVRRADGSRNPTPALYLDLSAVPRGGVRWVPKRVAPDDPTTTDLCRWDWGYNYRAEHNDEVARDAMYRAIEAFQQAEVHVMTAGGWHGGRMTPDDVREIFAATNTGGTPMTPDDVAALLAMEST